MLISLIFSNGICRIPNLEHFLPDCRIIRIPSWRKKLGNKAKVDQIIGWGFVLQPVEQELMHKNTNFLILH